MSAGATSQAKQVQAVQKVYSEWCVKATEIILASRVDRPGPGDPSQQQATVGATFQGLKVPERFDVRKEEVAQPEFFQLRSQRSFQVDIYHSGTPRDGAGGSEEDEASKFLERWTFSFSPVGAEPIVPDRHNQMLVRKLNVTLRSLLCFARLLPGHSFCRSMRGGQLHWHFHVEGWPPSARGPPAQELDRRDFASLQSSIGALSLSVSHRKELKAPSAGVQFKGTSSYSAQGDQIEVEEGYFAAPNGAPSPPASARGRLDKIAEEPDSPQCPGDPQAAIRQSALHLEAGTSSARGAPPRRGSEESVGSNASASSRTVSSQSVRDHTVALGSTPPLAAACWPGQPPPSLAWAGVHGGDVSGPPSRTASPRISPKQGPVSEEDPPAALATSAVLRQAAAAVGAEPKSAGAGLASSTAAGVALSAGGSLQGHDPAPLAAPSSPGMRPSSPPPGELDDLSNFWMRCPPEWRRHDRATSLGSASRGSGASRSLSPEDARSSLSAAVGADASSRARGSRALAAPVEAESQICMFGMSDDDAEEDEGGSDDGAGMDHNVMASAAQEGGGCGGAFAVATPDPDSLGLAGAEVLEALGRPSLGSSSGDARGGKLSPLITQLNPFAQPPAIEPFELPPAEEPAAPAAALAERAAGDAGGAPDAVQALLVEMGDLVCKLQQKKQLAITAREASPTELLTQLAHFRQAAAGLGVDL